MKVRSIGMLVCDIALSPIPVDIINRDLCLIDEVPKFIGGDAVNVAVSLSKMGFDVSLSAVVGDDDLGEYLKKRLVENDIGIDGVVEIQGMASASSYILIDANGERHFISASKINDCLEAKYIGKELLEDVDLVYFGSAFTFESMDHGGIAKVFEQAKKYGATTAMDACIVRSDVNKADEMEYLEKTLQNTDVFIPSIDEAEYLFGTRNVEEIADKLRSYGLKIFGVKMGSKGSFITDYKEKYYFGVYKPKEIVDTTGAGDTFVAGFLRSYLSGNNIEYCGQFASAAAVANIEAVGSTSGIKSCDSIEKYIQENDLMITKTTY